MSKTLTLLQLAQLTDSDLIGDSDHVITGVDELATAGPHDVSFVANAKYLSVSKTSKAGAIFVAPQFPCSSSQNYLVNADPSAAFQKAIEIFLPKKMATAFQGVHPTAIIHPTATVGKGCSIGPYAVVDQHAVIDDDTAIESHCYIGPVARIGARCHLHAGVVVQAHCILGCDVILQSGVIIGSCGFGYLTSPTGKHKKLTQYGHVIVEDEVEIGANTTIDRARFKTTRIGQGTKIDNLVQIAHGVNVGENNFIVAQAGIAGSTKTGKHVVLAGQSAIVGHVELADHVVVAGRGGVTKSLTVAGTYAGFPAAPIKEHHREQSHMRHLEKYAARIKALEERLVALEQQVSSN